MNRILILALLLPASAWAGEQIGTLTQLEGEVNLFTQPSKSLHKDEGQTRALFEGEYYLFKKAKIGDRVELGNIVRTALGAKARVVYDNGDQFNLGPGTSYRIFWDKDAANAKTQVKLMYGKLRGIVAKGGPRSQLQIRTKAATMGVRGTDFVVSENSADGQTEVSIIRGSVEVKPAIEKAKPVEIKSGESAFVQPAAPPAPVAAAPAGEPVKAPAPQPKFEVVTRATSQQELKSIQKSFELKPKTEIAAAIAPEVKKNIEKLEVKAVETTLSDIKTHQPEIYAKLNTDMIKSTTELNAISVEVLKKSAPIAPPNRKPSPSELEDLEKGAYEKYFKIID